MKILLIGYNRIGDTILSTGLINFLLNKYKNASFSIVTSSISVSIFEDMPQLEELIIVDKKKYSLHWLEIWVKTKSVKWDLIVDLRSSSLANILSCKQKMIFKGNMYEHKLDQLKKFIGSVDEIKPKIWANDKNYLDIYEKNDSIPEEIDELIDDYEGFFKSKSMDPVNQELVSFYEDQCIWVKG